MFRFSYCFKSHLAWEIARIVNNSNSDHGNACNDYEMCSVDIDYQKNKMEE